MKETATDKILVKLRESEALYKALVNNLTHPIVIHVNGRVVFANDILLEFTGLKKGEIIGKELEEILSGPHDTPNSDPIHRYFTDPGITDKEIEIRTENRKVILKYFLLRNSKIRYKGKKAVMSILFDITEQKHLEKYVLNRVIETEEQERKRFASDLHDDLGPTLSSIKLHLGLLEYSKDTSKFPETLTLCTTLLTEAIGKMRIIANNLMPRLIENYGLEPSINSFIKMINREDSFQIHFDSNLGNMRFAKLVELHYYRIACELFNNTIKHAGASKVAIKLVYCEGQLCLDYTDNGKGYNVEEIRQHSSGMGVDNILYRVSLIDGHIKFTEKNGKTSVRIWKVIDTLKQ
jgi:PAS domain S-box-containing protein